LAGRGSPSRAQQVRLGEVAKIKVKAEAMGNLAVHLGSIIARRREGDIEQYGRLADDPDSWAIYYATVAVTGWWQPQCGGRTQG